MARTLHKPNPPQHLLRFEWESFFYVLLWAVYITLDDKEREDAEKAAIERLKKLGDDTHYRDVREILLGWFYKGDAELFAQKTAVLSDSDGAWKEYSLSPCRFPSTFKAWVFPMWELFVEAGTVASQAIKTGWEEEGSETSGEKVKTVDEVLTYEALSSIFAKEPNQQE